jgi:hypothetical protein
MTDSLSSESSGERKVIGLADLRQRYLDPHIGTPGRRFDRSGGGIYWGIFVLLILALMVLQTSTTSKHCPREWNCKKPADPCVASTTDEVITMITGRGLVIVFHGSEGALFEEGDYRCSATSDIFPIADMTHGVCRVLSERCHLYF